MTRRKSSTLKNKVWAFVSHDDVRIETPLKGRVFANEWLVITADGTMVVKGSHGNGYAWDGCTPKWEVLDLIIGTPDGRLNYKTEKPITYYASMIHDVLYQFKADVPVTRWETDRIFMNLLREEKFFWWPVYFISVRTFGAFFGSWKKTF